MLIRELVALVAQALIHFLEMTGAVDQLHFALAMRRLLVGDDPDVGIDTGVVEHLVWQGDDGVQHVALDDPTANIGLARSCVTRE
ncbi:hypothetical protein D3C75_867450 [compost metagenome]